MVTKNSLLAAALASVALWTGCARGLKPIPGVTLSTVPAHQSVVAVSLNVNLQATVSGSNSGVNWTVSGGSACTGSACGSINSTGTYTATYTAPTTLPSGKNSLSITITATLQSDAAAQAQLTLIVLPITVTVAPTPVSVGQGLVQQFTATTTPDNVPQTFTWTLSCTQPGACGTLTQDPNTSGLAVYTAPATPPTGCTSSSCVTVTATSTVNPSSPASTASKVMVVAWRVTGAYTLRLSGYDPSGHPVVATGSLTFKNGVYQAGGVEDVIVNAGAGAIPQHYAINAATYTPVANVNNANNTNNAGVLTIDTSGSGGSMNTYAAVLDSGGDVQIVEVDGNGKFSGVMQQAAPAKFATPAALSGTFVLGFTGTDLNGKRVGYVGLLPLDGAGNIGLTTPGLLDINDNGVAKSSTHVTGTYTMVNGVGTMTFSATDLPGAPTYKFNLYGVGGQADTTKHNANPLTLYAISTDLLATNPAVAGSIVFQDAATVTKYDATALNNSAVVNLTGTDSTGTNTLASLTVATGDGNGNISGTFDANNAGTIVTAQNFTCTYTTDTAQTGRYVVKLLGNGTSCGTPLPFVFYASGNSRGFLLDQSSTAVMTGSMDPQGKNLNGTFAPSALPGTYAAATSSSGTSGVTPLAANLLLTSPGNQTYNVVGTLYSGTTGTAATGSYTLMLTGNGTLTLTSPAAKYVIYATDNSHFEMIDTDASVTNPSVMFAQQ